MSCEKPLVSIVTPSFNKGPYIEDTILSVRNQTYKNIEHIIIDGGSTDETLSILKRYENDLRSISEPDKGQSDAINKGWKIASGDIIAFLNADDTYLPDSVESAVRYFSDHPKTGMIYGDGILTDEQGKNFRTYVAGDFNLQNLIFCRDNILQPSVFLRKEVYTVVGDLDVELHLAMDLDYWIRIGLTYPVEYIAKPLSAAKIYQDAKSSAQMHKYVKEYELILSKVFSRSDLPPEIKTLEPDVYNFVYVKGGLDYIHLNMSGEGIRYLWKAFCINPMRCIYNISKILYQYIRKK